MDSSSSYDYTYSTSSTASSGDVFAIFAGLILVELIVFVIVYVVFSFLLGKIFKKAGVESWKAWVPIYNNWTFLELGDQKGWLSLLIFIPFVGIASAIFQCIAAYHIGLKMQKDGIFVLWYILLAPVWLIWLAFDSSTWQGMGAPQQMPMGAAPGYQPPATPMNTTSSIPPQDNTPMPPSTPPQNPMQ